MKTGQIVRYKRNDKKEYLGLVVGKDIFDDFWNVFDPKTKKVYNIHEDDLMDSDETIIIVNKKD